MKRILALVFFCLLSGFICLGQRATAHLNGRFVLGALPKVESSMKGTIVVSIKVDQYGNVTEAIPGAEGTTITDINSWKAARNAALKAHFNIAADAPSLQTGTITYVLDGNGESVNPATAIEPCEEYTSLKDLVEGKASGVYTVRGIVKEILDCDKLLFSIEQDDYIIPIRLVKKDLGAVNRFRSLGLKRGDLVTVKGSLSSISIFPDDYKGLVDAAITDKIAGPEPEDEPKDKSERIPFQLVEQKPSFNGGDANEFSKWVNSQLIYPEDAKSSGIQGRVTLQFTIKPDGSVANVKVLRGVYPSLDAEAVRVVSSSPKWKPGRQRDKAVAVTYTFPVIFQLGSR